MVTTEPMVVSNPVSVGYTIYVQIYQDNQLVISVHYIELSIFTYLLVGMRVGNEHYSIV